MTARITPPFRADHVGSLLRPAALHAARDDYQAGRITAGQLTAAEDVAITGAVRMQEEIGLRADIAAVYAAEVAALYELGCRYLQFDDTIFAFLNDPSWRAAASSSTGAAAGLDPDHQHEINVDGLFLEYDDERSGTFEPLRFVPPGQVVVLGLVTTKYVDGDRLCLSGQCGFASTVEGNALTIDEERAKLELIVQTVEKIWG